MSIKKLLMVKNIFIINILSLEKGIQRSLIKVKLNRYYLKSTEEKRLKL